jgi:hypothetical protein
MADVLARIPTALADMADLEPGLAATLLKQHELLFSFIHAQALGPDEP